MSSILSSRVLAFAFLAIPAAAQNLKLNGPLARGVAGEFSFPPQTSPDKKFLVYTADHDGDNVFELYSVLAEGKHAPVRLFGPVPEYVNAQITVDGSSVLFPIDLDGNGFTELASVPIDGSAPPTVLSGPLAGYVSWFGQSPDGARVLYLSYPQSLAGGELFSVPIGGGTPVKLNGSLVPGGNVLNFVLSNDGSLALYSADQDTDERVELFVAPVDGSSPARKLPIPLVLGGSVALFQFGPDGSHVFYTADQEEDERYELFSVPSDGSQPPRKLNGPLVPGGDVGVLYPPAYPCWPYCASSFYPYFSLSLDGQWLVYTANQDRIERFELYSVPADGSRAPVKLSAEPERDVFVSTLTYDSAWVIYQTEARYTGELFSAPIDGSAPARRISGPMTPGGRVYFFPQVSFDSRFVVYQADQDVAGVDELYSAPVDGSGPPVKLNAPLPPGGDLGGNAFGYPGFWVLEGGVAYQAEQERDGLDELYFVPVAGGAAPRKLAAGPIEGFIYPSYSYALSSFLDEILFMRTGELLLVGTDVLDRPVLLDELPAGAVVGDVEGFDLAPAGDRVVYQATEEDDLTEGFRSVRMSKPFDRAQFLLPSAAFILSERFVPDGSRVVFLAILGDDPYARRGALFSVPSDGGAAPVRLDGAPSDPIVQWFVLTEDGQRVVFQASDGVDDSLHSAPVDGSAAPTLLHANASVSPGRVEISGDGSRVALLDDQSELHSVPIDGSTPPLLISTEGRSVASFEISHDGSLVVFQMGAASELFVAPTDGSAAPRKLNGPLRFRGHVAGFVLAPDSTRAVYQAHGALDGFELSSVRIDGSAPPVGLHAALVARRSVLTDFQISSDSQRVVYRSDVLVDDQIEIYSVPIDASRSPVRLNGILVPDGDVLDYGVSPDGTRVVYRADQQGDQLFELFSTPIQGSHRPARLSRPLVPGGDVRTFQLSADSRTVVFTAERNAAGSTYARELTLLAAPITGQEKATELAGPWSFQDAGSVLDYRLSADASVVVYRADQDEPGVIELYAARRGPAVPVVMKR